MSYISQLSDPGAIWPQVLIIYLAVMNLAAFLLYGADKSKARQRKWRIPERYLLLLAVLGGSLGALLGMYIFRHKTKKLKFCVTVPVILVLQVLAALYFLLR